jgi:excisionase family DNA binding protein
MQSSGDPGALPRLLTANEAADTLHVSLRTVRRLIANKKLPIVRVGRAVRIRPEVLAALIEGK